MGQCCRKAEQQQSKRHSALRQGRTAGEHKHINGGVQPLAGRLRGDIVHQIGLEECRFKK